MNHDNSGRGRARRLAIGVAVSAAMSSALLGVFVGGPAQARALGNATVTPADHLKHGDTVSVSFTDFPAGAVVVAVQCDERVVSSGDDAYCDSENFGFVVADENGAGTFDFTVHAGEGFASTNGEGVCDALHPCYLAVTTPGLPDPTNAIASLAFGSSTTTEAGPAKRSVKQGKKLKLAVSVTSAAEGFPTGSVVVKDGKKTVATASLSDSGAAAFKLRLTPGKHKLKVRYTGDAAYLASSDTVAVTVKPKR